MSHQSNINAAILRAFEVLTAALTKAEQTTELCIAVEALRIHCLAKTYSVSAKLDARLASERWTTDACEAHGQKVREASVKRRAAVSFYIYHNRQILELRGIDTICKHLRITEASLKTRLYKGKGMFICSLNQEQIMVSKHRELLTDDGFVARYYDKHGCEPHPDLLPSNNFGRRQTMTTRRSPTSI